MARVSLTLEIPDLASRIEEAGRLALEVDIPLREVAKDQKLYAVERFAAGDFPPALKESTLKKKRAAGYPETPLVATGHLRDHLIAGVELAAAVVRPAKEDVKKANILYHGAANLPARDVLKLDRERAVRVYRESMEEPIRRARAVLG